MKTLYLFLCISIIFLTSCEQKSTASIEGLWTMTSVTMGNDEVTPNARWVRFHKNFTQESGNGWFQHSVGTWNLDATTNELSIVNTNGIDDLNEPFQITIDSETMTWNRTEDGQEVKVTLKRITELPKTHGDQLLGLWKLKVGEGNNTYFSNLDSKNDYILFRWDKKFVMRNNGRRVLGVYNAHGHKQEVELIPYNNNFERSFWSVAYEKELLHLKLLNADSLVTRTFERIHQFPK
jgi:hypothetical protein